MLAELEANNELAASVGMTSGSAGLSDEEQALFEELERESAGGEAPVAPEPSKGKQTAQHAGNSPESSSFNEDSIPSQRNEPRRSEPEPG
jgi:hypothetical protein